MGAPEVVGVPFDAPVVEAATSVTVFDAALEAGGALLEGQVGLVLTSTPAPLQSLTAKLIVAISYQHKSRELWDNQPSLSAWLQVRKTQQETSLMRSPAQTHLISNCPQPPRLLPKHSCCYILSYLFNCSFWPLTAHFGISDNCATATELSVARRSTEARCMVEILG